jgi:hypothetical protein
VGDMDAGEDVRDGHPENIPAPKSCRR